MDKLSLQQLEEMCKRNLDKKHVREVLDTITKADFHFNSGVVLPHERISSLYKLRLEIAKENKSVDLDFISDYEKIVSNLQQSVSPSLATTALFKQGGGGFFIFYEPDTRTILGILKGANLPTVTVKE